jgi:hypothetical protein
MTPQTIMETRLRSLELKQTRMTRAEHDEYIRRLQQTIDMLRTRGLVK